MQPTFLDEKEYQQIITATLNKDVASIIIAYTHMIFDLEFLQSVMGYIGFYFNDPLTRSDFGRILYSYQHETDEEYKKEIEEDLTLFHARGYEPTNEEDFLEMLRHHPLTLDGNKLLIRLRVKNETKKELNISRCHNLSNYPQSLQKGIYVTDVVNLLNAFIKQFDDMEHHFNRIEAVSYTTDRINGSIVIIDMTLTFEF